ncbi:hypothetical protein ABQE48_22070 [Mycolicibacterium thermoresistibile]
MTTDFTSQLTVQRFLSTLDDLTPAERADRIAVLRGFADYVDRTPDQMIEEVFDEVTRKYRRRNFYTSKAREFATAEGGPENVQLRRANVIRAFFIANGRRLLPDRPAWMSGD